jgi:Rrf2 family nitric oxide-sensitive transcriptional repressor
MISQAAEYSLRAVLLLATRGREQPLTTQQISDAAKIPGGYLAKILQVLVRAGVVTSQRGMRGGFVLGADPETLTLMDIVRVVDPSHRIRSCPLNIPEHGVNLCPLHRKIDSAVLAAERELRSATIAQMAAASASTPALCCPHADAPAEPASKGASHD